MPAAEALPLAVLAPITGAVLTPVLARFSARLALAVAVVAAAASAGVLAACAPAAFAGRVQTAYLGGWRPQGGSVLAVAFTADAFGVAAALVAAVVGTLALLSTLSGLAELGPRELGGFACLALLLTAAVMAGALTADLLHLFVWFEVAALSSYALTGFFLERPRALEATFKIIVLTSIAGFCIFVGTALLYQAHAAVNLAQLQRAFAGPAGVLDAAAIGLLLAGLATKAGLVPFCGWLPDAHTAAPGPVSALFSGIMINFGIVGIARVQAATAPAHLPVNGVLMVLGCASALFGAGAAVVQDDLKRLLAYDTVSQAGIVTAGLATATAQGTAAAVYHLLSHALFKALLFLIAGAVVHATGATRLSELGGLARRSPALVALFCVGAAAIAGVPPLNGYVSLGLLHTALREGGDPVAFAVLLAAQVATVAALTRAVRAMFARRGEPGFERDERLRPGLTVALGALAAACIATGVAARTLVGRVVAPAAAALHDAAGWAGAVLAGAGRLPAAPVEFRWAEPGEFALAAGGLAAGVALAAWAGPRAVPLQRKLAVVATGSVNDYALYLAAGLIAVCAALLALG